MQIRLESLCRLDREELPQVMTRLEDAWLIHVRRPSTRRGYSHGSSRPRMLSRAAGGSSQSFPNMCVKSKDVELR